MPSRTTRGLLILALSALVVRVGLVLAISSEHREPLTYEHGEIAENLLAGRGFSVRFLGSEGPTSQQAPLYPAMLAGMYWLFGVATPGAILAMQLVQCLAGVALVLCVAWLAWSLAPDRPLAGWLAGWGAALYPPHIYMATHIQVVPWSSLLLVLLAAVALSPRWNTSLIKPIAVGVVGGLLILFDPILALALPILAWAMYRSGAGAPRSPLFHSAFCIPHSALLSLLISLAIISPWLYRNWRTHGELVFIKSTFGYAFWQGNNSISWGTDKVPKPSAEELRNSHDGTLAGVDRALWEARHETLYIDDVLLKPAGFREFAGLSEPQRSRLLGQRAREYIVTNPGRYLELCIARLRYLMLFDATNPKAANRIYRLSTLAWLTLSVAGLLLWIREHRGLGSLWPLVAIFAAVILFHTLTIASARFRIPLEPLTFVWCGWGLARLHEVRISKHVRLPPSLATIDHA